MPRTYCGDGDPSVTAPHRVAELQRFFLDDKTLEHKEVNIEDLRGRSEAVKVIEAGIALYASGGWS